MRRQWSVLAVVLAVAAAAAPVRYADAQLAAVQKGLEYTDWLASAIVDELEKAKEEGTPAAYQRAYRNNITRSTNTLAALAKLAEQQPLPEVRMMQAEVAMQLAADHMSQAYELLHYEGAPKGLVKQLGDLAIAENERQNELAELEPLVLDWHTGR